MARTIETPGSQPAVDPKDAELVALKQRLQIAEGKLAAQSAIDPSTLSVIDGSGPHNKQALAESKHAHLTWQELHQQVEQGQVKLTDRHVLCSNGWYVNPAYGR